MTSIHYINLNQSGGSAITFKRGTSKGDQVKILVKKYLRY